MYRGVLFIPVELNRSVFKFLVDSGAAYSAINRKVLDKIIAIPAGKTRTVAPLGKEVVTTSVLRIEEFVVGSLKESSFEISIVDFPVGFQIDGALGMDFMGKYRITIEPDTKTLVLREIPKKK